MVGFTRILLYTRAVYVMCMRQLRALYDAGKGWWICEDLSFSTMKSKLKAWAPAGQGLPRAWHLPYIQKKVNPGISVECLNDHINRKVFRTCSWESVSAG